MERQHYLWTAGGATVRIFLAADVITRLREASTGYSASPEIGGILLGRRKSDNTISIDSFELLESEHRRGLTFTLSGADKRRLAQRMRASHRGLHPVGSFRTHRRQGLYMDQYDFDLMSEYFAAPTDVMLLIRPSDGNAGFFIWEEGDINRQKSYKEFPLDTNIDTKTLPLVAVEPVVAAPARQTPAVHSAQNLPRFMKAGLIAATAGMVAVLAFYTHPHRIPTTSQPPEPPHVAVVNPPVFVDINHTDKQYEMHVRIPSQPSPFTPFSPPASQPGPTAPSPHIETPPDVLVANNAPLPTASRTVLQPVHPIVVSEISLEPTQPGPLRRGIHHVPVLNLVERHDYKAGSSFSPARPIREVKPRLPEGLQPDSPLDVKVWIDETGQVTKAELLSDHVAPELAELAANTAYKWSFQPARLSERPVSSQMVMHFRFVPKHTY